MGSKLFVQPRDPEQIIEQIGAGPGGEATGLGVDPLQSFPDSSDRFEPLCKNYLLSPLDLDGDMGRNGASRFLRQDAMDPASPTPEKRSASSFGVTLMPTERKASDLTSVCKCMESTTTPSQSKISNMVTLDEGGRDADSGRRRRRGSSGGAGHGERTLPGLFPAVEDQRAAAHPKGALAPAHSSVEVTA